MKKTLLWGAVFALAAASPSFAQAVPAAPTPLPAHHAKHPKTPEQSAEHHTAKLTKSLGLSPDQQAKVQQILLAEAQEAQATKARYPAATQRPALHQHMQATKAKYRAQLQGVLSADQNAKLTAQQARKKGAHDGKQKSKS